MEAREGLSWHETCVGEHTLTVKLSGDGGVQHPAAPTSDRPSSDSGFDVGGGGVHPPVLAIVDLLSVASLWLAGASPRTAPVPRGMKEGCAGGERKSSFIERRAFERREGPRSGRPRRLSFALLLLNSLLPAQVPQEPAAPATAPVVEPRAEF